MAISAISAHRDRQPQFEGQFQFRRLSPTPEASAARAGAPAAVDRTQSGFHGLVGSSAAMRLLFRRIEAVAASRSTVLIVGESGTGKELVSRAIHECGVQRGPFIPFNCAAIPRDLVESELFGHRRGAFSGATADFQGLLRAGEGGTVLLDEITEMGQDTQAKLLRAIQERAVRPVGATREIPVDVRLVASTNRDPAEAVRIGQLRADLYYRLQVNVLELPPLRERPDDVAALVEHFIAMFNGRGAGARRVEGVAEDAMAVLKAYGWPGNVRELANTIESAFTFGTAAVITLDDLPAKIVSAGRGAPAAIVSAPPTPEESVANTAAQPGPLGSFAEFERELIMKALECTGGNKVQAARMLKISRKKLYSRIDRYRLMVRDASQKKTARGDNVSLPVAAS
ncbi:MAG TPA: sigma-54 dependent transcriptional regulator [Candidatus Binataceae bacterium]|nr:sigma-54 dependent transcriptional regulator [Candidatus Binataceae bacterium]